MPNSAACRRSTAFHEAGHFVVLLELQPSTRFDVVSIVADDVSAGRFTGEALDSLFEPTADDYFDRAVVLLAGVEAALRAGGVDVDHATEGGSSDREAVMELVEGQAIARAELRAREILNARWAEVETLAAELLRLNEIDGIEAWMICGAADGDPDAAAGLATYRRSKEARHAS